MNTFLLILVIIFIPFAIAGYSYAPRVPTKRSDILRAIELMDFTGKKVLFELGCGEGRACFEIARLHDIEIVGIEMNYFLFLVCLFKKALFHKNKKITFINGNFFKSDLGRADIIYTFGLDGHMSRLGDKIRTECKKGTQIISYAFAVEGLNGGIKDKPSPDVISIYRYKL